MPSVPIVFGGGLDRETGLMAMQPGGMDDLRNVHPLHGKFQVRRGFERVFEFPDVSGIEQTEMLGGIAVLGVRAAIYVTYGAEDGKVHFWEGDAEGSWVRYIDEWTFVSPAGVALRAAWDDPPIIILAEYNGIVFAAHTASVASRRAQTHYLQKDPSTGAWGVHPLVALIADGWPTDQEIRFRGVGQHIEYIVGWGWGTEDEDRPELVRVCKPGAPLNWDPMHYWIVGDEGDPVVACYPAAGTLLAFKETQTWECFGSSHADFGSRVLDKLYGMLQPRLACVVEGAVFAWTNEGPRIFTGRGTSEGLEFPLELYLPEPFDLAEKGDDENAFAVYLPLYRAVLWFYGRRIYACYIRMDGDWKWVYWEIPIDAFCGYRLPQAGWGHVEGPEGYPSNPTATVVADTTATLQVTNNSPAGDETLEVWLKEDGGSYALHASFGVSTAATDDHELTGLKAGWLHAVAVRYRRGPFYSPGHESSDPTEWPVAAQGTFTTTLSVAPTISSHRWERDSATIEGITLSALSPNYGTGYSIEFRRDGVLADTALAAIASVVITDTGITGETLHAHDCRVVTAYAQSPYSAAVSTWAGPPAPTLTQATSVLAENYHCTWTNAEDAHTEVWDNLPSLVAEARETLRGTAAVGAVLFESGTISGSTGTQPDITIRHKLTQFGVDDYSTWSAFMQVDVAIG